MNSSTQLLLGSAAAGEDGTERSWRCCRLEVVVVVNDGNIWGKYWLAMANRLKAGTKKLKLTERGLPSVLLSFGAWVMSRTVENTYAFSYSDQDNRVQINTLFSTILYNTAFFLSSRGRERDRLVDNNATFKLKVKGCYCHHNGGANQAETVQQSQARSDRKQRSSLLLAPVPSGISRSHISHPQTIIYHLPAPAEPTEKFLN